MDWPFPSQKEATENLNEIQGANEMTTITYLDERRLGASSKPQTSRPQQVMSLFDRAVAAWNRRKTERMLEGLPQEIRKDIGWPTTIGK
jgi:hypothetical protein